MQYLKILMIGQILLIGLQRLKVILRISFLQILRFQHGGRVISIEGIGCLPGLNINPVAADANANDSTDADGNGTLERNEYLEMLNEAGLGGSPDLALIDWMMNIMYQGLGNFATATAKFTGRYYFLPNYPRPYPYLGIGGNPDGIISGK